MFRRPSSIRSSTSAISHAQPTGRKPVVGEPDDPELRPCSRHPLDHRAVALLEDVQRDDLRRQGHQTQREEGEIALDARRIAGVYVRPPPTDEPAAGPGVELTCPARRSVPPAWPPPPSSGSGATCGCTTTRRWPGRSPSTTVSCAAFVIDPALLGGRFASGARTAFLLDSLAELGAGLRERGAGAHGQDRPSGARSCPSSRERSRPRMCIGHPTCPPTPGPATAP